MSANAGGAGDLGSVFGLARSPGEGNDNPLQYSCLGNPMDRGAWWLQSMGPQESGTIGATEHSETPLYSFCLIYTVALGSLYNIHSYFIELRRLS